MRRVIKNEDEVLQLLKIVIKTGKILIANGSEIYRVEDSLERICNSCEGLESAEVFAMTTSVFITINFQGKPYTEIVREKFPALRLNRIDLINDFSRDFCSTDMTLEEAEIRLIEIENSKLLSLNIRALGAGITCAFFSIMFGGNQWDFFASLIIGIIVFWLLNLPRKIYIPLFIIDMLSGFLSSALAAIFITIGFGSNLDMVIIGALMPYVPGVTITNAIRDILAGDSISGLMTVARAIFTSIAIVLGVGIVLFVYFGG